MKLKRVATALVLGSLILATQAASADSLTAAGIDPYGDPVELDAQSTYADAHANDPATVTGSAIPDQTQPYDHIPAQSTYADAHANDPVTMVGSAIPDQTQPYDEIPALSTYADRHLQEPVRIVQPAQSSTGSAD